MVKKNFRDQVKKEVQRLSKQGKGYKEINEYLKNKHGKSYRKQNLLEDIRSFKGKEKKEKVETGQISKYTPKKFRPLIEKVKQSEKGKFQLRRYSAVFGIWYEDNKYYKKINNSSNAYDQTADFYRTLAIDTLPKNQAELTKDFKKMLQREVDAEGDKYKTDIQMNKKMKVKLIPPIKERVLIDNI